VGVKKNTSIGTVRFAFFPVVRSKKDGESTRNNLKIPHKDSEQTILSRQGEDERRQSLGLKETNRGLYWGANIVRWGDKDVDSVDSDGQVLDGKHVEGTGTKVLEEPVTTHGRRTGESNEREA